MEKVNIFRKEEENEEEIVNVAFQTRLEAELFLDNLLDKISKYGCISILDYYDELRNMGIYNIPKETINDNKRGWKDLTNARVVCGYYVKLPKTILI